MSQLIVTFRGRYAASRQTIKSFRGRYATHFSSRSFRGRYASSRHTAVSWRGRYAADGPELEPAPPYPLGPFNPGWGRTAQSKAWQDNEGELEILELSANGRDLRDAVPYLDLELNESGPHSWSLTIPDRWAHYHPEHVGGEWEGVLTDQHDHLLRVRARWAGQLLVFVGVPTSVAHQRVAEDGQFTLDLTWSGVCKSWHLSQEAITQQTLRSSRAGIVRQDRVIREAAQAVGITVQGLPSLPALRLQHRQNFRPMDLIQRYVERNGLGWRFDAEKMTFFRRTLGSPRWTYGPLTAVTSENSDMANPDLYSGVIVRRVVESGDLSGNPVVCTTYGDHYSWSFPEPVHNPVYRLKSTPTNGAVSDFLYRDAKGHLVGVREQRGTIPYAQHLYTAPLRNISSVSWTFGNVTPGSTLTEGYAEVYFSYTPADTQLDEVFPQEFETSFAEVVDSPELAAIVGVRRRELDVDEVTGTQADALRVGQLHLERLALNRSPRALSCPLNLGVLPGQTIRVVDPPLNRSQRGLVRRVRHRLSYDPKERGTVIEASGWRN